MDNKPICAVQAFLNELEAKREQLAHAQELATQLHEQGTSASIHLVRESPGFGTPPQRPPLLVPGDVARVAVKEYADQLELELQGLEDTHRRLVTVLPPKGFAPPPPVAWPAPPNPGPPSEWDGEGRSDV